MLAAIAKRQFVRSTLCYRCLLRTQITPRVIRYNLTLSRTLKPSSFSLPQQSNGTKPVSDFQITNLVHGKTDLKIALTERASRKLCNIAKEDNNPDTALRIVVESGGCHGFQYNLNLTTIKESRKENPDLLVFQRDFEGSQANLIIDESSLEILQESKVDYTKELIGSSFKVVESPYTSTECGCGASFDFDFDKLEKKKQQEQRD